MCLLCGDLHNFLSFPFDTAKFSLSMKVTMGLRMDFNFLKATELLMAETDVSRQTKRWFCHVAVSGIIKSVLRNVATSWNPISVALQSGSASGQIFNCSC